MATSEEPAMGLTHPTVVPTNFDPADADGSPGEGAPEDASETSPRAQ